jgi:hypothetical protein
MRRQIFALLLCGLLFASCLLAGATEAQEGSLIIEYPYGDAEFDLYLIAKARDTGEVIPTEEFASYPLDWNVASEGEVRNLALTLQGYIMRDQIRPLRTVKTNEIGYAHFDGLEEGCYLVLGKILVKEDMVAYPQPSVVILPLHQGETVHHRIQLIPKYDHSSRLESTAVRVCKVWNDDQNPQRPTFVTVDLLRDGEIWDTVELSDVNEWSFAWEDLPVEYLWTVVEREVDGYLADVFRDGEMYIITNSLPREETPTEPTVPPTEPTIPPTEPPVNPPPDIPQTGMLQWPVPVLASVGLVLIAWGCLRRRRSMEE